MVIYLYRAQSNLRCNVCGGWGGEYGDARGVGPMCSSCHAKGGKL